MSNREVKVKLIVVDHYLSFERGMYSGMEFQATPNYTSTKKLKGYKIKDKYGDYVFVDTR